MLLIGIKILSMDKKLFNELLKIPDPIKRKDRLQEAALVEWKNAYYRGSIEGVTGVGKSRIAVLAAQEQFRKNPNAIVYVGAPTETLRDQGWPDEFKKWGCEDLIPKIKFICHASMDVEIVETEEVDLFIFDECHHATILNCIFFTNNKVWYVLGLSATIPKGDEPEKQALINRICPPIFKVTVEEGVELEMVADFNVTICFFHLNEEDKNVVVSTTTGPVVRTEMEQYKSLTSTLAQAMWKNKHAAKVWMSRRVNFIRNVDTRTYLAQDVMQHILEGKRTLIFCGSIAQSEILCGEWIFNSKTDKKMLIKFQNKEIHYLGAVNAMNEGQNIEDLDQILVVCLDSKARNMIQRIGRTIRWRPNHIGEVIVLVAINTADQKWYEKAFAKFDKKRIKEYIITHIQKRNTNGTIRSSEVSTG
jgi:superfamily II DNA or RNA helicase